MSQPTVGNETEALLRSLNAQRGHVLGSLEGLSDEDLRRPVLPSGWTCLGLVQHLALDVERWWFRAIAAGDPVGFDEARDNAWIVSPDLAADAVFALYRREIELANAIIAATSLDTAPFWWPVEHFPPGFRYQNLREIVLHVITETAAHDAHLDVVRELIDGRLWLVLT